MMKYRITLTVLLIAVLGASFMVMHSTQSQDTTTKDPVVQSPQKDTAPNAFSTMKVN